ncbi:MAG: NAD(P)-dependent oxidoreductase [Hyphomicrobiales bacterium]|nr:NAD(P)-dependent oxidoreductase [Hyphomicrobiales bacterium]
MSVLGNGGSAPLRRKILLTGGSGFVGRMTAAALIEAGHDVHVASRRPARGAVPAEATVHAVDLSQEDTARRLIAAIAPEVVLHLAWCVIPGQFWTDPANLDWLAASLRLARAAAEGGVRRFVGAGTCFEYDWPADTPCIEEVTPLRVHTLYDAAKSSLAATLRAYFATTATRFAWARLFYLYGPGEDERRFVPQVARALLRGERARCTRGEAMRDFLDVSDAGAALAGLAASDYSGDVNVASGTPIRLAEIAQRLAKAAGRPDLLDLGALPDRADEPPFVVADVRILREEIGFEPRFDLDAGLARALDFWRQRENRHV